MNLLEVRNIVKTLLDEDGVRRPDSVLDACINDGYQLACVLSQACERTITFTYNAESHFAPLSSNFFVPIAVYADGVRLYPVRMSDLDELTNTWMDSVEGDPLYYFTMGALTAHPKLWIHPRPVTNATIKLVFSLVPDRVIYNADIFMLPQNFHYTLVWWATSWELLKERQPYLANKAYRTFQSFIENVNELQAYVYRRTPDRDYVSVPWDNMALLKKIKDFEINIQRPQTSEQQDISL